MHIWIDSNWNSIYWPGTFNIRPKKLLSLLESRPDLPVFIVNRDSHTLEAVSRNILYKEIEKALIDRS